MKNRRGSNTHLGLACNLWCVNEMVCQCPLWHQDCGPLEDVVLSSTSRKTCNLALVSAISFLTLFFFPPWRSLWASFCKTTKLLTHSQQRAAAAAAATAAAGWTLADIERKKWDVIKCQRTSAVTKNPRVTFETQFQQFLQSVFSSTCNRYKLIYIYMFLHFDGNKSPDRKAAKQTEKHKL